MKSVLTGITLLLWMAGHAAAAEAQRPSFDLHRLHQGIDSMSISVIRGNDTIAVGQLWDDVQFIRAPVGEVQVQRFYRTVNRLFGPHLDSTVAMAPNLKPIRRWSSSSTESDSIVYRNDSAIGWVRVQAEAPRLIARSIPPGIIDPGGFDLVVRTADLAIGYSFKVQTYLASQDSVVTLSAVVAATERIRQRDGTAVECWRVEGDFAGLAVTMWVDKATRALAQETIRLAPTIAMHMVR